MLKINFTFYCELQGTLLIAFVLYNIVHDLVRRGKSFQILV